MSANRRHPWVEGSHRGQAWTEAEVGVLRDLWPDHRTMWIAALLSRTRGEVSKKARALQLPAHDHEGRPYQQALAAPSQTLREEIALARAEWGTAPAYRPGGRDV
jgi:hypothetical protein